MGVVMFDGYAGPGWVWPTGRNTYAAIYGACTKVLKLQTGNTLHHQKCCVAPLWGADFKAASFGRGFYTGAFLVLYGSLQPRAVSIFR